MHDNPALYPHLPTRPLDPTSVDLMLRPVEGTEWQTCWEYVLTHEMTHAELSAFWHGANLAHEAMKAARESA